MSVDPLSAAGGRLPPGFFGKLPSRGDFVTRRLPQEFIARWDGWLQSAIAASRAELGAGWLDVYLTSPVWRFALAPGACGPQGWIGVMIPSVDKVGRYFPLAAVIGVENRASPLAVAAQLDEWFEDVEELLLATLAETPLELDAFDDRLARLVPTAAESAAGPGVDPSGAEAVWHFTVPDGRLGDALDVLGADALTHAGWRSVWWTQGSERIDPCVLLASGLPEPRAFVAMLDGGWAERGWRRGRLSERRDSSKAAAHRHEPVAARGPVPAARSAGITDTGKVREINEDAWACRDDLGVWLVADGLGGHQAGELASRMVVAALEAVAAEPRADAVEQLVTGLRVANRCLRVLAERGANIHLAASTVAALVVDERGASCVWAGDSRVYRLRNGRLEQLSADHSEAAGGVVDSRAVTRAVGGADVLELGVARSDVRGGDRFLLCTDGLYAGVDAGTIVEALMLPEPELGCARLRDAVLVGDARDNLTAVVVHVGAAAAIG